ncbi:MAG: hypothetical protein CVV47_03685 [Spirochaetae bacterium HGW-Spirochaetae-3]|jgi:protease-4|nr:MAG: hypothetical protein CVV47_03685 [Spirochaetae bacterium HGW-Spirochaetae-3]
MIHRSEIRPRAGLVVLTLFAAVSGLFAQAAGSADPVSVWDYSDNPAAWGLFPDAMAFGFRGSAALSDLASYSGGAVPGSFDLAYGIPGLFYKYSDDGVSGAHELTTAFGVDRALGAGLRFRWDATTEAASKWGSQDFGLIVRPFGYASMSLGIDDVFDIAGDGFDGADLGLAIRPLAFDSRLETMLTLSADARLGSGSFSLEGVGARFLLGEWLSVQGRYSFADSSVGVGLSVSLSGSETAAGVAVPSGGLSDGSASLGQSMRLGRAVKSADRVFGRSILVIDEPGSFSPVPPRVDYDPGFGNDVALWFDLAVAAIDRAASDSSIGALTMIEPPRFDSDARAQEFGRALARFRKAGKPAFVYARSMDRLSYVYAAAGAELVALDPNGALPVVDAAAVSLYFKGLLAKLGIEAYNLQSHDTKTAYNSLTESGMTDAERAMLERYVGGLAAQSYAALDAARPGRLPGGAAGAIAAGPYLDPRKAVEAGLVDELMYRDEFDDAVLERTGIASTVDVRSYARERGLSWGRKMARKVAVVYLSGNIIEGEGVAGRSIGDAATAFLASLRDDPTIAGVILRVDSGGGSALTSDHIAREVKRIKEAGKPVVVSMASYAASGGYYISAYADRIIAEAGTITGSIGVTGLDISLVGMLEKLGIGAGSVSASRSGVFGNPFLPRRPGDADASRSGIMYVYERFVDVVAEGRKMERARVDELGKGQVWLGREAVENGLVDAIGGLSDAEAAMEELLGAEARYVTCLPGEAEISPLLSLLGAEAAAPLGFGSSGAVGGYIAGAVRLVDELAELGDGALYLAPEYLYRPR